MIREEVKVTLMPSGFRCYNPACGAELYVELMIGLYDSGECFNCDPDQFLYAAPPPDLYALLRDDLRADLFHRAGGRPPARGDCSEDCCR